MPTHAHSIAGLEFDRPLLTTDSQWDRGSTLLSAGPPVLLGGRQHPGRDRSGPAAGAGARAGRCEVGQAGLLAAGRGLGGAGWPVLSRHEPAAAATAATAVRVTISSVERGTWRRRPISRAGTVTSRDGGMVGLVLCSEFHKRRTFSAQRKTNEPPAARHAHHCAQERKRQVSTKYSSVFVQHKAFKSQG